MTAEPCRDRIGDLGAGALGRLSADESLRLASHVDGCAGCRAELAELRAAAAALAHADLSRVSDRVEPPASLAARIAERVDQERRSQLRRRWRRAGVVATAAAAAVTATLLAAALVGGDGGERGGGRREEVAFSVAPAGTDATAVLVERRWGTEVRVALAGFEQGDTYWLWLSGEGDERVAAGTFAGVPGEAEMVMASAMPFAEVRRVWVTDAAGTVVLDARVPG
jgi:hypothetical protein